jgi:dipeptidase E
VARIVAIGGGEMGRPGFPVETTLLDDEVVRRARPRRPLVVFLPTASADEPEYVTVVHEHYGGRLGCRVEPLLLYDRALSPATIASTIAAADIVYVGGGNTLRMMKLWRRRGVDRLLAAAAAAGTVLAGVSAGAICWCARGVSDSRSFAATGDDWPYIGVRGLGLVDVLLGPHHDAEPGRPEALVRLARVNGLVGLGLDDCAALEVVDDRYRILACRPGRGAHRVGRDGEVTHLAPHDDRRPLRGLLGR